MVPHNLPRYAFPPLSIQCGAPAEDRRPQMAKVSWAANVKVGDPERAVLFPLLGALVRDHMVPVSKDDMAQLLAECAQCSEFEMLCALLSNFVTEVLIKGDTDTQKLGLILAALPETHATHSLELHRTCLGHSECELLADFMRKSSVLRKLEISGAPLDNSAVNVLAEASASNTALSVLDLAGCSLNSRTSDSELIQLASLTGSARLQSLALYNNPLLGDEALVPMLERLNCNTSLKDLLLSGTALGKGSIEALARSLPHNQTLELLTLPAMSDDVLEILLGAMRENKSLRTVHLHGQRDSECVRALHGCTASNSRIKSAREMFASTDPLVLGLDGEYAWYESTQSEQRSGHPPG